jgi:5'-3' exonuclease
MGVPSYFNYIVEKYPEVIQNKINFKKARLFLDMNCAIHKCCRKILNEYSASNTQIEILMFKEIISYINYLVNYVNPELLYIGIDGVCPRAKMEQQRLRRHKSIQEKNLTNSIREKYDKKYTKNQLHWDTNQITPGTQFMENLSNYIKNNLRKDNIKIILSDSNVPGEGEHKIINYIKKNKQKDTADIIYGLDADLIMLSMTQSNIFLLRESLEFGNKIEYDAEGNALLLYLDIDTLKDSLFEYFLEKDIQFVQEDEETKNKLFKDYIFLCFLLGNDFLPHINSISIKEKGIEKIIDCYITIYKKTKQNIVIKDKSKYIINLPVFKIILGYLRDNEDTDLQIITNKKIKSRMFLKASNQLDKELEKLHKMPQTNHDIVKKIYMGFPGWKERYYKEKFYIENNEEIQKICINYFEGLNWNLNYYFNGCISWSWYYKYRNCPALSDLYDNMDNININELVNIDTNYYLPFEQLLIVLPPGSNQILPKELSHFMIDFESPIIEYYPINFQLDTLNKVFYWQCTPILPMVDDSKIKKIVKNTNINENDNKRNIIRNDFIIQ